MPYLLDENVSIGTKYRRWTKNNNYNRDYLITDAGLGLRWGYGRTRNEETNKTHHHKLLTSALQNGKLESCNPIMMFGRNAFLINQKAKNTLDNFNIGKSEIWDIKFSCSQGKLSNTPWYATNFTESVLTIDLEKTPIRKYSTFGDTKYNFQLDFSKGRKESEKSKHSFYLDGDFKTDLDR